MGANKSAMITKHEFKLEYKKLSNQERKDHPEEYFPDLSPAAITTIVVKLEYKSYKDDEEISCSKFCRRLYPGEDQLDDTIRDLSKYLTLPIEEKYKTMINELVKELTDLKNIKSKNLINYAESIC